jgi:hypothetical protein
MEWGFSINTDVDTPDMSNVVTAERFVADNYAWDSGPPGFDGTDPHRILYRPKPKPGGGGSAPPPALPGCVPSLR